MSTINSITKLDTDNKKGIISEKEFSDNFGKLNQEDYKKISEGLEVRDQRFLDLLQKPIFEDIQKKDSLDKQSLSVNELKIIKLFFMSYGMNANRLLEVEKSDEQKIAEMYINQKGIWSGLGQDGWNEFKKQFKGNIGNPNKNKGKDINYSAGPVNTNNPDIKRLNSEQLQIIQQKEPYIKEQTSIEWKQSVEIAKKEIRENGIPDFQKAGYIKDKSETAFNNITPRGYGDLTLNLKRYYRFKNNLGRDKDELLRYAKGEELDDGSRNPKDIYYKIPKRDDAFLLYLGMPQKNNSFGISDYQPQRSKDKEKIYFKLNYLSNPMKQILVENYFKKKSDLKENNKDTSKVILNEKGAIFEFKRDSLKKAGIPFEKPINAERVMDNPLGDFKVSEGKDEKGYFISIYDIRDLTPFQTGEGSSANEEAASSNLIEKLKEKGYNVNKDTEISSIFGAGKPFEIYDRIYYDPITKKILE